jgi:hypothetical protein
VARGSVQRRFLQRLRGSALALDYSHGVAETSPFAHSQTLTRCGYWQSGITTTARQRMAMPRAARPRWPHSPRAGGEIRNPLPRRDVSQSGPQTFLLTMRDEGPGTPLHLDSGRGSRTWKRAAVVASRATEYRLANMVAPGPPRQTSDRHGFRMGMAG